MSNSLSRRSFFVSAATAAAAQNVIGANDRVRLGIIGTYNRGRYLMKEVNKCPNVQWVSVCDAWDQRRDGAEEISGPGVSKSGDYRQVLDRKDIDAVIVSTWDNTHAKITIDACHAGKDVYVEKPMTSRAEQGPQMVKAVRDAKRVVQVGVQRRSGAAYWEAKRQIVDSGKLGRVHLVRTRWNNNAGYRYKPPANMEKKPAGLDWNACLGDLPKIPWDPWRYFNHFSYIELCSGMTGGLFVHFVDVAIWYLGLTKPTTVVSLGGIYEYKDGRNSPDNTSLIAQYPENLIVTFEASVTDKVLPEDLELTFIGEHGRLHMTNPPRFIPAGEKDGFQITAPAGESHMANWLNCVRSRKQPNAPVEDGHWGAVVCHMANLSWQEKRAVTWNKEWDL
jgi:predicted dehydrogenase